MNKKLLNALSNIVGKFDKGIIKTILSGNSNPEEVAKLADGRCKRSREE